MRTIFLFIPILGSPLLHLPVLRFDLLRGLKRPIDAGRTFRGQRLFGENKTWRGALCMAAGALLATVTLSAVPAYWRRLPLPLQGRSPWLVGALLGVGLVLGELPNSFIKRQLRVAPGTRKRGAVGLFFAIFDQADFVPMIWLLLLPLWRIPLRELLLAFATVVAVHLVINLIGFALGARRTAI